MGQAGRTGAIIGADATGTVDSMSSAYRFLQLAGNLCAWLPLTSIQLSKSTVFDQEQSEQWWIGT